MRLPFEPKGWLVDLRAELAAAARALHAADGELLDAVVAAPAGPSNWDVENVLFYNVGTGCFAAAAVHGVRFARADQWPTPPTALSAAVAAYHRYELRSPATAVDLDAGPLVASWHDVQMPAAMTATSVWAAMATAPVTLNGDGLAGQRYALRFVLRGPARLARSTVALLKPIVDGVVASFHQHDGTKLDDLAARVDAVLAGTVDARPLLMHDSRAVLGRRRLLWPRAQGVQWNPADDLCVVGELLFEPGETATTRLDGRLVALPASR